MSGLEGIDMRALADILREESSSSSDDDEPSAGLKKLGPGEIGKSTKNVKGNKHVIKIGKETGEQRLRTHPDDIWDINEVDLAEGDDVLADPRIRPEVDIIYSQNVTSEDIFLQMGQRTPMTSSCELMVVRIQMPGEMKDTIECDVTEHEINIRSILYRLHLPLQSHAVNPGSAKVEWDSSSSILELSLELVRDLDHVNF